jgi:hypothetical protein
MMHRQIEKKTQLHMQQNHENESAGFPGQIR